MSWRDGLVLAARSILRRPARTALTIIAVALGTGLLVALAAIADVADTRVLKELGKGGPATAINVAAAQPDPVAPDSDNPRPGAPRSLDDAVVSRITRAPSVSAVVPVVSQQVVVIPPPRGRAIPSLAGDDPDRTLPRPFNAGEVGVDLARARDLPITLIAGRLPAADSMTEVAVTVGYLDRLHLDTKQPSVVLGTEVELGAPQVVGLGHGLVRARWSRAAITGVVAQQVAGGTFLTPIQLARAQRSWQVAGADGQDVGLPLPQSQYSGLIVLADSLDSIHTVRAEITTLGYSTTAPEHLVASVQRYLHVVDIVLASIGTIALVIAALGISNALLAAVRERRREIGVLKAIGARDRDVLRWFLTEALMCGISGGILGTLCGLLAIGITAQQVNQYLIQQGLAGVDLGGAPWTTSAIGVLGAVALSLVAAAWPALRAARLPAREAVDAI